MTLYNMSMSESLHEEIINLVPKIDKARLYRGKGGELFRQASCYCIQNTARSHLSMPIKTQLILLELLNENLKQPHGAVREKAASALRYGIFHTVKRYN